MPTASTTLTTADLISAVRSYIGESFGEEWQDGDILTWINVAITRIADEYDFDWLGTAETISIVPGTESYTVAHNIKSILSVRDVSTGGEWQYVDVNKYDESAAVSAEYYTIFGGSLLFRAANAASVRVRYYQYPDKLVNSESETTVVPVQLLDAIMFKAAARSREQEEELPLARAMEANYQASIAKYISTQDRRIKREFRSLRPMAGLN